VRSRWRLGRSWDWLLLGWVGAVLLFLLAPIVTAVVYSFNEGQLGRQTSTFTHFTTRWYSVAWTDSTLRHSVSISFRAAIVVAVLSVVLGTITGITLARHPSRLLRGTLQVLVYLLLIVPEVVLAVSLLLWYTKTHVALGLATLIAGHTPYALSIVALIVRSRVVAFDRRLEESAGDLGARSWQVTRDVLLPQLRPALIAGVMLAFTLSFDDLVISDFLATPTVTTLPVYLFGTVHTGTTPEVYAAASMMLGFTLTVLGLTGLIYRWQTRRVGARFSLVPTA
jgi:ABC-type spermidine/putrescine transport system permease subunit II